MAMKVYLEAGKYPRRLNHLCLGAILTDFDASGTTARMQLGRIPAGEPLTWEMNWQKMWNKLHNNGSQMGGKIANG